MVARTVGKVLSEPTFAFKSFGACLIRELDLQNGIGGRGIEVLWNSRKLDECVGKILNACVSVNIENNEKITSLHDH